MIMNRFKCILILIITHYFNIMNILTCLLIIIISIYYNLKINMDDKPTLNSIIYFPKIHPIDSGEIIESKNLELSLSDVYNNTEGLLISGIFIKDDLKIMPNLVTIMLKSSEFDLKKLDLPNIIHVHPIEIWKENNESYLIDNNNIVINLINNKYTNYHINYLYDTIQKTTGIDPVEYWRNKKPIAKKFKSYFVADKKYIWNY